LIIAGFVVAIGMASFHALQYVPRAVAGGLPAFMVTAGVVLAKSEVEESRFGKIFVLCGDASYVLYLSHPFSINIIAIVWQKLALPYLWFFVIVAVVASICGSLIAHFFVERPLLRWLAFLR
jgi:peptidoglycan/LPS O-acetylase OafA/YrhL